MYYSYTGKYRSSDLVDKDEARMHAKYNTYMSKNGQDLEDLNPTYDEMKSELRIGLFADSVNKLNDATAVFFFINKEDINQFKKYSMEETAKYYKNKGFSCNTVK